jgi:hypothetical protein
MTLSTQISAIALLIILPIGVQPLARTTRTQAVHVCTEVAKQDARADRNTMTPNNYKRVGKDSNLKEQLCWCHPSSKRPSDHMRFKITLPADGAK